MFDLVARVASALVLVGLALAAWPWHPATRTARAGRGFAKLTVAWVQPVDVADVDNVLSAGWRAPSYAFVGGAVVALLLPGLEPAALIAVVVLSSTIGLLLVNELQLRAFGRLACRTTGDHREPAADFLHPVVRWFPFVAAVATALSAALAPSRAGLVVAVLFAGIALVVLSQRRRVLAMAFVPRDPAHAYLLDGLRAFLLTREVVVSSALMAVAGLGMLGTDALSSALVAGLLAGLAVVGAYGMLGTPRFRRRRWPQLVADQVVLGDQPYPPLAPA